ncbi:MAG: hypothetical protein ROZ64_12135 [Burkholderiaceae bacterium]|nr:hypothetical protein [Burkholderiaceae bacterium]
MTLQPLPFIAYSLQAVEQVVLPSTEGAALINLPDPARQSLHKVRSPAGSKAPFG